MERLHVEFLMRAASVFCPPSRAPGAFFRVQWRETPVARACFLLASSEHDVVVAVVVGNGASRNKCTGQV